MASDERDDTAEKKPPAKRAGKAAAEAGKPPRATRLSEDDIYLFREGTHSRLYEKLGAHRMEHEGQQGYYFAVWAPAARFVSVVGSFNDWNPRANVMLPHGTSGIWETFIPGLESGHVYKFHIQSNIKGYKVDKADPFAIRCEEPPRTASVLHDLEFAWSDEEWMRTRAQRNALDAPQSVYEMHLGSWRRHGSSHGRFLSYDELAEQLPPYLNEMGFTHVELMPVMEHPFYGSWGYQTTGYFAPTARFGEPQGLMRLIDALHRHEIGVLLDWVPSHFPVDPHGLGFFDGTHLFEHEDPRQGFHPDWKTLIYNYGRKQVLSFLISNALFWMEHYHADGLRVDAVASMLYLDYSRDEGEWVANEHGGKENLDAISFLRQLNATVFREYPGVQTVAEESTSWPMVSRPVYLGGLGFGMKWDMGWMHDTLEYMSLDPIHRKFHHDKTTFRMIYAGSENFILPLSHDEVVHGKGSLLSKMPGDVWAKFANLRALYGWMYAQPGKKLLFMGSEIGPWSEWNHDHALPWHQLQHDSNLGLQHWVRDLNRMHTSRPAMHERDCGEIGFEWIDCHDYEQSVLVFMRWGKIPAAPQPAEGDGADGSDPNQAKDTEAPRPPVMLVACNFTPIERSGYRIGVPYGGRWKELLNSDAEAYGGSGKGNLGGVDATEPASHGHPYSMELTLPPMSVLFFEPDPDGSALPGEDDDETVEGDGKRPREAMLKPSAERSRSKKNGKNGSRAEEAS